MSRVFCLLCSSLTVILLVPSLGQRSSISHGPQPGRGGASSTDLSTGLSQGLCRDGWMSGSMNDFSGKEIPICFKVNPQPQSWHEAQASCRLDYGFLLKLDSKATLNDGELLSTVLANGITKFWSGIHTENDRLVWDDLIPNQVRPYNQYTLNDTSVSDRPWRWEDDMDDDDDDDEGYCGQLNLIANDDDRRRRRKRSPDDDNSDFGNFESSSVRNRFLGTAFGRGRGRKGFAPTSPFTSMLTRTQMSDQLAELPSTSLGMQAPLQLPGSGLSEANIQNGGLSTVTGNMEGLSNTDDGDSSPSSFFSGDLNNGEQNTGGDTMIPTSAPDLLGSVRDVASTLENAGLQNLQDAPVTESPVEQLRKFLEQNTNNFQTDSDNSDSNTVPSMNIMSSGDLTKGGDSNSNIIPSLDSNSDNTNTPMLPNGIPDLSGKDDTSSPSDNGGLDLSKLSDIFNKDTSSSDIGSSSDVMKGVSEMLGNNMEIPSGDSSSSLLTPPLLNDGKIADAVESLVEKSNDNIGDTLSNIESVVEKVGENVGDSVSSNIGEVLDNLKETFVEHGVEKIAEKLSENGDSVSENVGDIISDNDDGFSDSTSSVSDISDKIKDALNIESGNLNEVASEIVPEKIENAVETLTESGGDTAAETLGDMSNIGEKIAEAIEKTTDVSDSMLGNVDDGAETIAETLTEGTGVGDLPDILSPIEPVVENIETASDTISDIIDDGIGDASETKGNIEDNIEAGIDAINDILEPPVPIIPSLEDILPSVTESSDNIADVMDNLPDTITDDELPDIMPPIPGIISDDAVSEAPETSEVVSDILEKIKEATNTEPELPDIGVEDIGDTSPSDIVENIGDLTESLNEQIAEPGKDGMESITETMPDIFENIADRQETVSDGIEGNTDLSDVIENIKEELPEILSPEETTSDLTENIQDVVSDLMDGDSTGTVDVDTPETTDILDDVFDSDTSGESNSKSVIDLVQEHLGDSFGSTEDKLEDRFDDVGEKLEDTFGNVGEKIEDQLDNVNDKIEDTFDNVGDKMEDRNIGNSFGGDDMIGLEKPDIDDVDTLSDVLDSDHGSSEDFSDIIQNIVSPDTDDMHDDRDEPEVKTFNQAIANNIGDFVADLPDQDDVVDKIEDVLEDAHDDMHDTDGGDIGGIDDTPSFGELDEIDDSLDDVSDVSLAEDIIETARKVGLVPIIKDKGMELASCEEKLPSVCFTYEVEIMNKASTCEDGWYGHVLLDTCYKILSRKSSYSRAIGQCAALGGRLVMSASDFERQFVLIAVQREGKYLQGAKFWMESPNDKKMCQYFSDKGLQSSPYCNAALHVVCVKDAKSLSVFTANNVRYHGWGALDRDEGEDRVFPSQLESNKLPCVLTSGASEFPVLWYKDGVLVETKDKYLSKDLSLYLNQDLKTTMSKIINRELGTPALQGKYWCEVWDRQTLTRKRSKSFNVRYSDVISFIGSMKLNRFSNKEELLFNMINEKFPALTALEMDLKLVFNEVLKSLKPILPDLIDSFTFIDHVRSKPNVVEYHTYFTLNRDYTLADESRVYSRIKNILRSKLGNRNFMARLPGLTPLALFRTLSLQSTVSCPSASLQTNRDLYGHVIPVRVFNFPKANLGEFANSLDTCSMTNSLPVGNARCLGDFYTGAYWGDVVANDCIEETPIDGFNNVTWGVSPFTQKLTEMAQSTVNSRNVQKLVSEVAQITQVAAKFTPTDINKIADVLDHTSQVGKLSVKVGQDMLRTVDKLMSTSSRVAHVANVETKAANRIIKSLERFAENADIGKKDKMRFVSDNVVLEIWDLKPSSKPVIGLAAQSKRTSVSTPFKTEHIATIYNKSHLFDANVDAAIELPAEVFNRKEKGRRVSDRLTMMVFRKSKLFEAAITDGTRKARPTAEQLSNLNSYVISASIAGKNIQDLKEKVKTIFKPLKDTGMGSKCVWWDFDMNNMKGGWSSKGCVYDGKVNGRDVCLCNHLTNFAVLIDMYGQMERLPEHHELSLSIITLMGLSLSILGLALTIISYLFFRKLRQGRAQQTLFNLSLALLLSMLVFLVGIKQTHSDDVCKVVAILLHYLILVSFMWMLMEAILQYLTFVKILGTYITRFTMKTVVPAWGLPLIPVISVLSVDSELYKGGPYYCWMSLPAFYYAFAIPVTCIIVVNIVIFFITVISIFRRGKGLRSNQKKHKMAITNLQAAITSFILLGLTWIFGYLAIADARITFQYVFTILNSLQGFFIFVLFVVRKKKVREQWYFICCKGVEKDRVSRSLSASNSIPSTYSNGSNRNSRKNERERPDSTKTVQSTYSTGSNGFLNYGYDHGYDNPFSRYDRRAFRKF